MHVARHKAGELAMMLLSVDDLVPEAVMKEMIGLRGIETARLIQLS
jgi:hypothetical protein